MNEQMKDRNNRRRETYEKLMASLLVSGLVISGVGIYHVEAASGNTSQTVEQLTHGQKI